ncbi:hypothetical protein MLD38_011849 [Melastoma candidum]|uniref:Uncharacterized protein n=1 Tax=Melastoma candidum TaxID=119954 RepID=A0ACB9R4F1_9MYRT|nr:hypothetical protein MLD38_011849 [Melastoma candidum]
MDQVKEIKGKKNLIAKTWERCKSLGRGGGSQPPSCRRSSFAKKKSKSWNGIEAYDDAGEGGGGGRRVAPKGCFSVYVGAEKRKFVVRTEFANHPLFRVLLEQAEAEYGYNSCGPIELPCDVEIFYRVLREMDGSDDESTRRGSSL